MRLAPRTVGVIFLLVNVVVWGAALPIVKPALSITTPIHFLFYRYFFAALLSLPILVYYLLRRPKLWRTVPRISAIEFLGTVISLALLYEGLARTTSLEASLVVTTLPVFVTIGGIFLLKEREDRREWAGLALAVLGTLVLTLEPIWQNGGLRGSVSLSGNVLILIYNFVTTGYLLLAKKYYQRLPKFFVTALSFWLGLIAFGGWTLLGEGLAFQAILRELRQPAVAFASLYMATFGSIIGLTAYIIGQSKVEASEASVFTYLEPIIYVPLAVLVLNEPVTPGAIVAIGLIMAGVFLAEFRGRRSRGSDPGVPSRLEGKTLRGRALRRSRPKRRSR
jgi:drug/metabolite transporter (DMT)-like permease